MSIARLTLLLAKGQDWMLELRVMASERVQLAAPALAGATSLTIYPLEDALATGDKLLFDVNTVITLSAPATPGTTTLAVSAIPGPLRQGAVGQKMQDLTGYSIEFEALHSRGDTTAVITKSGASVTILPQGGDDRGKVQIDGVAADTANLEPKTYFAAVWRRNAGSARPLAEGDLILREAGFL